jgi:hypothetical protein
MSHTFMAQSLVETRTKESEGRFETTFVDAAGRQLTISLPVGVAADLSAVLHSLSACVGNGGRMQFTRMPKLTAVGSARHERLVLIRFDDEPPYGFNVEEAESLWREVREEAKTVARLKAPVRQ